MPCDLEGELLEDLRILKHPVFRENEKCWFGGYKPNICEAGGGIGIERLGGKLVMVSMLDYDSVILIYDTICLFGK